MAESLQDLLDRTPDVVGMLRNAQRGANPYPVQPEFTNWIDEQEAWQNDCILFDLSYHMVDLRLEGPGALDLLTHLGPNSFARFPVDTAKHFAPVTPAGHIIGDVILFRLSDEVFDMVGRVPSINWVMYHADTGDWDVTYSLDQRSAMRTDGRRRDYRLQIQGPNAMAAMERLLGGPVPDVKFFHMTTFDIAGRQVHALRHGMAGQPGFELFGPYDDKGPVVEAIVTAGADFGLRRVGGRAYSSNTIESGWVPSPLPGIYTGESLRAYREWLPAEGYEGIASIGGSFASGDVEDYYFTPWDLGYGGFVRFDHDFIGREALEEIGKDPQRTKVTLDLHAEDVLKVMASYFQKGPRGKFIDFPSAVYAMHPYDAVLVDGETIGVSTWIGYSSNERTMLTLAIVDNEHATPGTEVTLIWGEENGRTLKPKVETHTQMEIRATVSPVPYAEVARTEYRKD